MKPRVFVSSTIKGNEHDREAIRNLIEQLGYEPVMSEYEGFGCSPDESAIQACYSAAKSCDIGILVIAKRYGFIDKNNGKSITHNEYLTMCAHRIPCVLAIDSKVQNFYELFKENNGQIDSLKIPEVKDPKLLFEFIEEIYGKERNNFVSDFRNARELCDAIRTRLAYHFRSLLENHKNTGLSKDSLVSKDNITFLKASNKLREEGSRQYQGFLERITGNHDAGTMAVVRSKTFEELANEFGYKITVEPDKQPGELFKDPRSLNSWSTYWSFNKGRVALVAGYREINGEVVVTKSAYRIFEATHNAVKASIA
jgi:hypothetical protein